MVGSAGEHLNVVAGLAEEGGLWKLAKITPLGDDGIAATLIIPGRSGGGWIWPVVVKGNALSVSVDGAAADDCAAAPPVARPAFDCSALLAEAARLEQTAARMEGEAKVVRAPDEETRKDFAARRLNMAHQSKEAARALRWAASANRRSEPRRNAVGSTDWFSFRI